MQINSYHVAVLGGGIVGKACALLLAAQGIRTAWIAPPPHCPQSQRVYALSASSQRLLERLRVWQTLKPEHRQRVSSMEIFSNQQADAALHFSAYGAAVPQLAWIVQGDALELGLQQALAFSPQVHTFADWAHQLSYTDEAVCLSLQNGATVQAECLVAADGAASWARTQAGIEVWEHPYQQMGVVANFHCELPHQGIARQWFMEGEVLALLPLPEQHYSMVWSASVEHADALLKMESSALAAYVQQAATVAQYTGSLQAMSMARAYPLTLRIAKKKNARRMVFIGDAAHHIHPLAGQGLNLGLQDVIELSQVFSAKEGFRSYGDERLLRRYARGRAMDTLLMAGVTHTLQNTFAMPGRVPAQLRHVGMQLLDRLPGIKNFLIKQATH